MYRIVWVSELGSLDVKALSAISVRGDLIFLVGG